jgi:hypothetical protein
MRETGIKNACFSYSYSLRTPGMNWFRELDFLDRIIVDHGFSFDLEDTDVLFENAEGYIRFLNRYEEIIDFAFDIPQLGIYVMDSTPVKIIPFYARNQMTSLLYEPLVAITTADINRPFFGNHYRQLRKATNLHGYSITGVNSTWDFDSVNTSSWMLGRYGYTFYWDGKLLQKYYSKKKSYRSFVARQLIKNDYEISYKAILKDDLEEVHKMNLIAWKQFAEHSEKETRRK